MTSLSVRDLYNSLTEEQKDITHWVVGAALTHEWYKDPVPPVVYSVFATMTYEQKQMLGVLVRAAVTRQSKLN